MVGEGLQPAPASGTEPAASSHLGAYGRASARPPLGFSCSRRVAGGGARTVA